MSQTKVSRRRFIAVAGGTVVGLAAGFTAGYLMAPKPAPTVPTVTTTRPVVPQILRIGYATNPVNLSPFKHGSTSAVLFTDIYETLTFHTPDLKTEPLLSNSWKPVDKLHWAFELKKGIKMACGKYDFDAYMVQDFFTEMCNPTKPGYGWAQYRSIVGAKASDKYNVVIETSRPVSQLPHLTAIYPAGIACMPHMKEYGEDWGIKAAHATGPFMLKDGDWAKGEYVKLTVNENYWQDIPKLKELRYVIIPEDTTRVIAYGRGDIDNLESHSVPPEAVAGLRGDPDTNIHSTVGLRQVAMMLRTDRGPTSDVRVRKAIAHLLDREKIVKSVIGELGTVATNFVPAGLFPFLPMTGIPNYDPAKAKSLLSEAGWKPGAGGILEKDGKPLDLVLVSTYQRDAKDKELAEAIAGELNKGGLNVKVRLETMATYTTFVRDPNNPYDMSISGWTHQTLEWEHSTREIYGKETAKYTKSPYSRSQWENPEFDRLYEEIIAEFDSAKAEKLMIESHKIIAEELPAIPIYDKRELYAIKKYVKGFQVHPDEWGKFRYSKAYIEKG